MIDWTWTGYTPWTNDVAILFLHRFRQHYRHVVFPGMEVPQFSAKVVAMFAQYIVRMKKHYVRQLTEFGQIDSLLQILECDMDASEVDGSDGGDRSDDGDDDFDDEDYGELKGYEGDSDSDDSSVEGEDELDIMEPTGEKY
jgi:hypothetical protein